MRPAEVQFLHGRDPSPMHLTFLRWQASQALLTAGGVDDDEDSGMLVGEGRIPLEEETSRGPEDRFDNNILAMRFSAGDNQESVRVCNAALGKPALPSQLGSVVGSELWKCGGVMTRLEAAAKKAKRV